MTSLAMNIDEMMAQHPLLGLMIHTLQVVQLPCCVHDGLARACLYNPCVHAESMTSHTAGSLVSVVIIWYASFYRVQVVDMIM